jgi:hypothetical protein
MAELCPAAMHRMSKPLVHGEEAGQQAALNTAFDWLFCF